MRVVCVVAVVSVMYGLTKATYVSYHNIHFVRSHWCIRMCIDKSVWV